MIAATPTPSFRHVLLSLICLSLTVFSACDDGTDTGPAEGETVVGETLELDGVFVMVSDNSIYLIDPNTATLSPRAWSTLPQPGLSGGIGGMRVTVSPDGRHLVYILPEREGLALMEFRWLGDIPTLEEVRRWEIDLSAGRSEFSFNRRGDRIRTPNAWIDVHSDRIIDCGADNPLIPLPDGRHFYCYTGRSEGSPLYRDFELLGMLPRGGASQVPSPDGQWLGPQVHLLSETEIGYMEINGQFTAGDYNWNWNLLLPNNQPVSISGGWNGRRWAQEASGAGGWTSVWVQKTSIDLPEPHAYYRDLEGVFQHLDLGVQSMEEAPQEALTASLEPLIEQFEEVTWEIIGFAPSSEEFVYWVRGNDWESISDMSSTTYLRTNHQIQYHGVKADGTVRIFELADIGLNNVASSLRLVPFGHRGWAVVEDYYGFIAGIDDQSRPFSIHENLATFSQDGMWILRTPSQFEISQGDFGNVLCIRAVAPGTARYCINHPSQGYLADIVGQGQHPAFAGGKPVIVNTSSDSMYEGGEVQVLGNRFGESGTLYIGEHPVEADAILSWTPSEIRFQVRSNQPATGALVVETSGGRSNEHRTFWLDRTERTETVFSDLNREIELKQGLNLIGLNGPENLTLPSSTTLRLTPPQPELDSKSWLFLGVGLEVENVEPLTLSFYSQPYKTNVVATITPGLAEPTYWQPVAPVGQARHAAPPAFDTFAGLVYDTKNEKVVHGQENFYFETLQSLPGSRYVEAPEGAYIFSPGGMNGIHELVTGRDETGAWLKDPDFSIVVYHGMANLARVDDTVLVTGRIFAESAQFEAAILLSFDGGETLEEIRSGIEDLGIEDTALQAPLGFTRFGEPYFLTRNSFATSFYAVDHLGQFHTNAVENVPTHLDPIITWGPYLFTQEGPNNAPKDYLYLNVEDASPEFAPLFADGELDAEIVSHFVDRSREVLDLLLADQTVWRIDLNDPSSRQLLELNLDFPIPADIAVLATRQLPEGRWLARANVMAPGGEEETFLVPELYLVSPPKE